MNSKTKRRMIVVAGIIVIVAIVLMAVVGAGSSAKVATVADTAAGKYADQKVQVTGVVVDNSYSVDENGTLVFDIAEQDGSSNATVHVTYDKGVSATFGNGVVAICTGRVDEKGTIVCSELVTKCPSKYESASSALSVEQLVGYGNSMLEKTTKVAGYIVNGSLGPATQEVRFVLVDSAEAANIAPNESMKATTTLNVVFSGALSDEIKDGTQVVVMGALDKSGNFLATDVAIGA